MPTTPERIEIACDWCAGTDVARDAWAEWNVERQEWVLGLVTDDGWCFRCECARGLVGRAAQVEVCGGR